jgi:hypothetical protein
MEQAGGAMQDPASHELETTPTDSNNVPRRPLRFGQHTRWPDFIFAALAIAAYVLWIYCFRYRGLLGEDDLYRMLVGLLDGARYGTYLASESHYGKAFSFGYIAAIYRFADAHTLADPQRLIALMNEIGFWSAAAGCFFFWLLAWMLYGLRSATVALIVFALSPMMLELGTSGHPILPAFALLAAGSCCLLLPVRGVRAILLGVAGALLLAAALSARAELLLAFPFVVLARADFATLPRFLKSAGPRAIAAVLAAAAFFLLKHAWVDSTPGSVGAVEYVAQANRLNLIPIGAYVLVISCGVAATAVGAMAIVAMVREARAANSDQRAALVHAAAGPLLLILPALAFWISNARPGRHFILCLGGIAILAGWLMQRRVAAHPLFAYALAFGIVAGNQAMGALIGPIFLRYAPSKIVVLPDGSHHLPRGIPTGSSWSYHRAFVAEQLKTTAFAMRVEGACEAKTLVLSLEATQIFADLYPASTVWNAERGQLRRFLVRKAQPGERTIWVLSENEGWPDDAAADALADPALRDFKLVRDPNNLSIYDHVVIPPDRMAHLGCASD